MHMDAARARPLRIAAVVRGGGQFGARSLAACVRSVRQLMARAHWLWLLPCTTRASFDSDATLPSCTSPTKVIYPCTNWQIAILSIYTVHTTNLLHLLAPISQFNYQLLTRNVQATQELRFISIVELAALRTASFRVFCIYGHSTYKTLYSGSTQPRADLPASPPC